MAKLDKSSPIPLYYQLYSILLDQIRTGDLRAGDMLPTEVTLVDEYNVSRATVRQAILDLARNGYVVREKSKGTFVRDYSNKVGYSRRVSGFTAISSQGGSIPLASKVLDMGVLVPPKVVAEALRLKEGEKAFYLKRVRYVRNEPNTYVEDWLPYSRCPGIEKEDFSTASLYDLLERDYHVIPHHAVRTFDCCCAYSEEQLTYLKVKKSTHLLRCESSVYDENGDPVEYYTALIKGKYTVHEHG
ncbi:MAG: GntR family transcriptional regulator [Clostridia bacterium]|nr:GntR family transcriptional regulator [Clostridia bacterium]